MKLGSQRICVLGDYSHHQPLLDKLVIGISNALKTSCISCVRRRITLQTADNSAGPSLSKSLKTDRAFSGGDPSGVQKVSDDDGISGCPKLFSGIALQS
jgi:hypothetical protein